METLAKDVQLNQEEKFLSVLNDQIVEEFSLHICFQRFFPFDGLVASFFHSLTQSTRSMSRKNKRIFMTFLPKFDFVLFPFFSAFLHDALKGVERNIQMKST